MKLVTVAVERLPLLFRVRVSVGVVGPPTVTVDVAGVTVPVLVSASVNVPLMVYGPGVIGATRVYVKALPPNSKKLWVPAAVLFSDAVVLTSVNPEGMVSTIFHAGLTGRFELGVIVTTIVAPGVTVVADKDLVTLPTLGAAIACEVIASTTSIAKEIDEIYFIVFICLPLF